MKVSSKLIAGVVLCAGLVHMASAAVKVKVTKKDPKMEVWYNINQGSYKKLGKNGLISVSSKKNDDIYFRMAGQTEGKFVTLGTADAKNYEIVIDEEGKPTIKRLQ